MTNETMRQKLVDTANLLKDLTMAVVAIAEEFGEVKVEEKKPEAVEETKQEVVEQAEEKKAVPEKKYSFADVRKFMSEKSGAGFTDQVRALLEKYGASRLSEIKEEDYAALMKDAEEIG